MAKREIFTCDVCGKDKRDVNHWWLVDDSDEPSQSIEILPWDDGLADDFKHICGQECATKKLSEWLETAGRQK